MLKQFKDFAAKGNMVDMAVGFVMGAAFATVIKSLVDDILMPLIASIFGTPDFRDMYAVMGDAPTGYVEGMTLESFKALEGGVALGYGLFINALIAFLLIALALFFVVKGVNNMQKPEPEAAPAGPSQEDLLGEIRDLLKK